MEYTFFLFDQRNRRDKGERDRHLRRSGQQNDFRRTKNPESQSHKAQTLIKKPTKIKSTLGNRNQ